MATHKKSAILRALFFFTLTISISVGANAATDNASTPVEDQEITKISQMPEWHKVMHYRETPLGGFRSEIPNDEFFFSRDGKTRPEAELRATLKAFRENQVLPPLNEQASCAFPLRLEILKKYFPDLKRYPDCKELESWLESSSAESVTLVFSSYFPAAPASMFGHSFLRLNRTTTESFSDLAIDYSASIGEDSRSVQVPKGLFGFYNGAFSVWPYYVKVKEYNNAENRDLFEYDLSLTKDEVRKLSAHVWELRRSKMPYYFLKRNCSYEILALLEAAKPEWNLTEQFTNFAIPIDTVRAAIKEAGALKNVKHRHSLKRRLEAKWNALPATEKVLYENVIAERTSPTEIRNPLLAETLGLHYVIKQIEGQGKLDQKSAAIFHAINITRSQLPELDEAKYQPLALSRPDEAHRTNRVRLGVGSGVNGVFLEPDLRPALHELIERDSGYAQNSTLEFARFRGRWFPKQQKVVIENVTVVNLLTIMPWSNLFKPKSFEINAGIENLRETGCLDCTVSYVRGSIGAALEVHSLLLFQLFGAQFNSGGSLENGYRLGSLTTSGLRLQLGDRTKFVAMYRWSHHFNKSARRDVIDAELNLGHSWSNRSETHVQFRILPSGSEGSLAQALYF